MLSGENKEMIKTNEMKILGYKFNPYVVGGFIFGLIFIIIAWGIEFLFDDIPFSLKGIVTIHRNLVIYIADSAPFVLAFVSYFLFRIIRKREDKLNEVIRLKDDEVRQLSEFTTEIGKGNFQVEASDFIKSSKLGKVLIEMKKQLAENYKKEKEIGVIGHTAIGKSSPSISKFFQNLHTLAKFLGSSPRRSLSGVSAESVIPFLRKVLSFQKFIKGLIHLCFKRLRSETDTVRGVQTLVYSVIRSHDYGVPVPAHGQGNDIIIGCLSLAGEDNFNAQPVFRLT